MSTTSVPYTSVMPAGTYLVSVASLEQLVAIKAVKTCKMGHMWWSTEFDHSFMCRITSGSRLRFLWIYSVHQSKLSRYSLKLRHNYLHPNPIKFFIYHLFYVIFIWPCIVDIHVNNVEDQLDATITIYWYSNQLNMLRTIFCPSSGVQDCVLQHVV